MPYSLKQKLGAALIDIPRYELGLRRNWATIRNRRESLSPGPNGVGVACKWRWTSELHVTKVFPSLGARLMQRSIADWPISFADAPTQTPEVQLSFVIGHRGLERLPLLLATLSTIAAQRGVGCECIVVEQSAQSQIAHALPAWVRHVHTPPPSADMPYCRSWTLNVGARMARGKLVVFHDNDMLIPQMYAAELWARFCEGHEVINLKRFIYYLAEEHSKDICARHRISCDHPPQSVVQNLEAGGSVAVSRDAFFSIGGYDESFVGWGGEDNEFWERALTRSCWPYSYLPIVHLWHRAQPGKGNQDFVTMHQYRQLSTQPVNERIANLTARNFGDPSRMDPAWSRL